MPAINAVLTLQMAVDPIALRTLPGGDCRNEVCGACRSVAILLAILILAELVRLDFRVRSAALAVQEFVADDNRSFLLREKTGRPAATGLPEYDYSDC